MAAGGMGYVPRTLSRAVQRESATTGERKGSVIVDDGYRTKVRYKRGGVKHKSNDSG